MQLLLNGVSVSGLEVHTPSLDINTLLTFWMQSDVDLSRGLDFLKTDINNLGPIWARLTHLQHRDFEYHIIVRVHCLLLYVKERIRLFIYTHSEGEEFKCEKRDWNSTNFCCA